ncbi:MAG: hypothetical protein ACK4JF_08540 [Methylohalobius sp.]
MIEPVAAQNLFLFFMAAAGVVLLGFGYALLYALGRAYPHRAWRYGALLAYALLVLAVLALVRLGDWNGRWRVLAGLLLLGYGLAPIWIFRLMATIHQRRQ